MIHGAVRPFEVPVKVSLSGDKLIGTGEVSFNYTDFGIEQPSILGLKAGNMVKINFHIVALRAPQGLGAAIESCGDRIVTMGGVAYSLSRMSAS